MTPKECRVRNVLLSEKGCLQLYRGWPYGFVKCITQAIKKYEWLSGLSVISTGWASDHSRKGKSGEILDF